MARAVFLLVLVSKLRVHVWSVGCLLEGGVRAEEDGHSSRLERWRGHADAGCSYMLPSSQLIPGCSSELGGSTGSSHEGGGEAWEVR